MKIGIAGLGLIGGSIAKALTAAGHAVYGFDINKEVESEAIACGAIAGIADFAKSEAVFVCLCPRSAAAFMLDTPFAPGALVTDICGVKRFMYESVAQPLKARGVLYVGSHPMAGREVGGFANSSAELFSDASYIITREADTDEAAAEMLAALAADMGCGRVTYSSALEHDMEIAYTSQLAHVVSNCYVKNPAALKTGFSAGSFLDLTRVAKMDSAMWAELFLENADFLSRDIDIIVEELTRVRAAIEKGDEAELRSLLKQGSDIKGKISPKK